MIPLPLAAYTLLGLLGGLLGIRCLARCAHRKGSAASSFLLGVLGLALAIDASRAVLWRTAEAAQPLPAWVPLGLVAALAAVRIHGEWRRLGRPPAEPTGRREKGS